MDMSDLTALGSRQRVFRAREKIQSAGLISHITQRAAGREPLFVEEDDSLTLLSLLKEVSTSHDIRFYALCLMPNHVHLLLEPQKDNLSEAMHSIFSRYARRFNRKYRRKGHIFGGPYRQAICLDSCYLLTASVYIHLNPVRAGLVDRATEYRWSSCNLYCKEDAPQSFVDPGFVLALLGDNRRQARRDYAAMITEGKQRQPDNALEQEGAIERFLLKLLDVFPSLFKEAAKRGRGKSDSNHDLPDLAEIEEHLRSLPSGRPRDPESLKARRYVVEQLLARGYTRQEVADRLQVSRKTIYNILQARMDL